MTFGENPEPRHNPECKRRGRGWFCLSGHSGAAPQSGSGPVDIMQWEPSRGIPGPRPQLPAGPSHSWTIPHSPPLACVSFLTHRSVGGKEGIRKAETDLVSKQQIKTLQVAEEPQPRKCNDAELGKAGNELALEHIPLRSLLYDRAFRAEIEQATGYTDSRLCVK